MCYNLQYWQHAITDYFGDEKYGAKNNFKRSTGWSVGCREAAGWGGAGCLVSPGVIFPLSLRHWPVWRGRRIFWRLRQRCPAASESNRAEEGGKEELKGERGPKGRRAGGPTASPRRDLCRAHRGRTQGRAAMERSAEEDYKEKLLWNVKREVGEALAFSFTFTVFNGCFLLLITWKPTKGCSGCYAHARCF